VKFRDGHYPADDAPHAGLAAARAIAMITYRSPQSLGQRFGRASGAEVFGARSHSPHEFAVRGWLRHHGQALAERFDANSYLRLLDAMDSHDLARGRASYERVLASIEQPVLIGSLATDALYVPEDQRELARLIPGARLVEVESQHGHDGFLIDAEEFHAPLLAFKQRHSPIPSVTRLKSSARPSHTHPDDSWLTHAALPYST
jgi:homoserine O-acetyltransferase